ncbi:N-acetylmuramoyl-L-alanine amidase [Neobacillus vireti]|uniref:N-acetylmuramoyl-L-alanine amidase n=1 Tax=Neobacillus vireti TaxID=220686 RepID=UPI002FFECDED
MAMFVEDFVKVNPFTRPALKLLGVKGIVMHYTATPNASAKNERDYFNGTCITQKRYASAHVFIDKKEARQIIPFNEVAYHANEKPCKIPSLKATASYYKGGGANLNTIGIELCIEKDGSLHPDTLKRAIDVVAYLCKVYKLNPLSDIYRHYDITGKNCPAFWVSNPKGFEQFKADVKAQLAPAKTSQPAPKPAAPASTGTYKVVKGDTLSGISKKYGMAVAELKSLNGLKSDLIKVGQVLKVKGPAPKTKLLTVLVQDLYTYKTANWNNKGQLVHKGDVFTVVDELMVSGSKMYKLKSGLYITANTKYVSVK